MGLFSIFWSESRGGHAAGLFVMIPDAAAASPVIVRLDRTIQ
jgi:hypothetical protein